MGKRITSLQEITTVTDNDFIPVDNQSSGVRKLSAGFLNDIEDALDGKQDALTAGANIEIAQDGTISATDTTYTAGTNVDITNGVISATDTNTDALSELTDTAISSPSDGDALVYDSTSGKWVNGGVASDIGDLNDVDITSPSNGQVLSYNSTSQEWENTTPSAGSSVSVTQVQSSGTKIATVTVDNVDTDLYAPTGGGGGGSTSSYGYTIPSSSSGSDGDIYNKIEDITGTDETVTTPVSVTTNTTFQFPKSISEYSTITVTGSNGGTDFEPQTVAVENIGADMNHQTYIGTSGVLWYKTTDSVVMWATNAEITSCYGTYTNSHKIVDIYQKTSDSWSKYEDKGSIVVANPSGTATIDLEKISIDGTIYDIPSGGSSGGGNLYGTTDPTNDLGNNGDIYMKYQGGSEPVEGETETLTNVYLNITKGNDWVALPNFDTSLYYSVIFNHSSNQVLSTKINISDISTDANNPTIFGNTYDDLYGYINNSTLYLKTITWNTVINSAIVTLNVFQPPQVLNVFGKVDDEWVGFPKEGYEEITLWEGSQSITQYSVPFTIPDIGMAELNKYDAFAFDFYSSYSVPRIGIMLTSHIKNHQDTDVTLAPDPSDGAKLLLIHYDSANDVLKAFATTNYGYTLTKVVGIKYGNGGGSSKINYSTDEQVVGTWIDGKPVYELTFPLAIRCNIPAEQTYDINDYITDGDFLIDYKLYYVNSPNVHDMTGTIPRMQFWKNNNIQYIAYNGLGISAIDFTSTYATFRYTKTTD